MYRITKSDLQDLEMLKNIENEMYDCYMQLFQLDKDGKKDSLEYENILKRVKDIILLEDNIFSRLITSKEQIDAINEKIRDDWEIGKSSILIDVIFDRNEMIKARIANKFSSTILNYFLQHPESRFGTYGDLQELTEYASRVNLFVTTSNQYLIIDTLNISLAIMSELEESDGNCKWAKYALPFQVNDIEKELIKNGFRVNSNPFLINGLVKRMFSDVEDIDAIKESFLVNSSVCAIRSLIVNDDYSLLNSQEKIKCEWNMCYLRGLLVLMDNEQEDIYMQMLKDLLNDLGDSGMHYRSRGAIENILANHQRDKEIPQIVGLNL